MLQIFEMRTNNSTLKMSVVSYIQKQTNGPTNHKKPYRKKLHERFHSFQEIG
jgi:hypothetical protein